MDLLPIQLFDAESSTYTYILRDPDGKDAVIIDPVDRHCERDLQQLERLGLHLAYVLETHAHADAAEAKADRHRSAGTPEPRAGARYLSIATAAL